MGMARIPPPFLFHGIRDMAARFIILVVGYELLHSIVSNAMTYAIVRDTSARICCA